MIFIILLYVLKKIFHYGNCFSCNILFIAADKISFDLKCLQSTSLKEFDTARPALM